MNFESARLHLEKDERFIPVLRQVNLPETAASGRIYYDLLESIVSQQLSVKVADIIFKRFISLFPDHYPHPEHVISMDYELLRSIGLSNQKAGYIQNVAHFATQNNLETIDWSAMTDNDILIFLTQIKGVGKWTVEMLLMFSLGRPDVFPVDDLGIQQAMIKLFNIEETGKSLKTKMIELAEPWRPYRTIACRYLWRWKDAR